MRRYLCGIGLILLVTGSAWAEGRPAARVETLAKATRSWDGTPLPGYPKGTPEITILRITVPPGVRLPLHSHPVINAGVLLRGELTVVTEKREVLRLKAGDSLVEVVDTWHHGTNEGHVPAEIVVFYAGERGSPITVHP